MNQLARLFTAIILLSGLLPGLEAFAGSTPERIISLDYCADQYLLKLAPKAAILALSTDAEKPFSYMRKSAAGFTKIRPRSEDVLVQAPDLVVRSYGGGGKVTQFLEQAGIPVLQLGFANSIKDIVSNIETVSRRLGTTKQGQRVIENMRNRLVHLRQQHSKFTALYITPGGVTAGPGTLINEMMETAGVINFQQQAGWHTIPLERLAYEQPDILVTSFYDANNQNFDQWSVSRHALINKQLATLPVVAIDGATTACGAWFILDGVAAIAHTVAQRNE